MPHVICADIDTFYVQVGTGPDVVLIHGWCSDSTDWSEQIAALSVAHRVTVYDLAGHGRSGTSKDGYTPGVFAAQLLALMDELRMGAAHVVAHSLGALVACVAAEAHPQRIVSLVLIDPAYGRPPEHSGRVTDLVEAQGGGGPLGAAIVASMGDGPLHTWNSTSVRRLIQTAGMEPAVVWSSFAGMHVTAGALGVRPNSDRMVRRRRVPTLVIHADQDRADWERSLCTGRTEVDYWPEVGHFLHLEQPERFNARMSDWLRRDWA
jgi:pimeloyl-ACP methyl ester carboxylesterase